MTQEPQQRLPITTPRTTPFVNTLLYGPAGSGKTTSAASSPGPVLYLNADRENATYFARKRHPKLLQMEVTGWKSLMDVAAEIKEHAGDWGTVVIDPIADVYRLLIEEASNLSLHPALDAYRDAGTRVERFCRGMCDQPVNFVIVAHDWPVKDDASGQIESMPYTGSNSNPSLSLKLQAMVDVLGYCGVVQVQQEDESTLTQYMAQLINANGRRGKDRFDVLGKARELDLGEWVAQINKDHPVEKPQTKKAA